MSNVVAMFALGALIAELSGGAARSATYCIRNRHRASSARWCGSAPFGISFRGESSGVAPNQHVLREKWYSRSWLRLALALPRISQRRGRSGNGRRVDQLETYFGSTCRSFFYATTLAPVTLFFVYSRA